MRTPRWLNKELGLIKDSYFAVYNTLIKRWEFRRWNGVHVKSDLLNFGYLAKSDEFHRICMRDKNGYDVGYREPTMKDVRAVRKSWWIKERIKKVLSTIDESNDAMGVSYEKDTDYIARDVAKRIWHRYREPTVYLGG